MAFCFFKWMKTAFYFGEKVLSKDIEGINYLQYGITKWCFFWKIDFFGKKESFWDK